MLRITVLACYFFLVGCGLSHQELVNKTSESVVRFVTPTTFGARGSGSFIETPNGDTVILTNAHVCNAYTDGPVTVKYNNLIITNASVMKNSMEYDLCVVFVSGKLKNKVSRISLGEGNYPFQEVLALGYPLRGPMTPSFGYVLNRAITGVGMSPLDTGCPEFTVPTISFFGMFCIAYLDLIDTNLYIFPGNSGSPVVDMQGDLVGVINSGSDETHYGGAVPIDIIKNFLKDL